LPRSWGGYLIITALSTLQGVQLSLVSPYLNGLGFPPALIGGLVAVATVVALVTRVPVGAYYRSGRTGWLQAVSILGLAAAIALHPLAVTVWSAAMVRALTGLTYGIATTVTFARFVDEQPPGATRARAMGYYSMGIAGGYSIASLLVGFVVAAWGYQAAFLVGAGLVLVGLLGLFDRTSPAEPASAATRAEGEPAAPPARRSSAAILLASPALLVLSVECYLLNAHWAFWNAWLPLYALAFGIGLADVGVIRTTFGTLNAFGRPLGGNATARFGARRLAASGLSMQCLLLPLLLLIPSMAPLLALFALLALLRAVGIVANTVGLIEAGEAVGLDRGRVAVLFATSNDLGILSGPITGGLVAQAVGPVWVFVYWPLGMLAIYLAILLACARPPTPGRAASGGA
jgi:MFS family permease